MLSLPKHPRGAAWLDAGKGAWLHAAKVFPGNWMYLSYRHPPGGQELDSRSLFNAIMHYGEFDRMPVWHWRGWTETMERWYSEGLPRDSDDAEFLGAEHLPAGIPINIGLLPPFEEIAIEEAEDYRVVRQSDGVIAWHSKIGSSVPRYVDFTFKDRSAWPDYRKRLQPDPARIPQNLDQLAADLAAAGRPVQVGAGSMVGWLRNWMGVENLAYACHDDPDLVTEVADTIADLVCWCLDQVLPKIKADLGWGWEDICFRAGPLVSPETFARSAVPAYRKVSDKLLSYGCDLRLIDCDGKIDDLAGLWLDGGVNVVFPVEIGTWNADPAAFRRRYGKELRIIGGINKLVLERGRRAIDEEIERRKPLMAEGGFIPLPDHLITPGTLLDDYRYYLDRIRELRF